MKISKSVSEKRTYRSVSDEFISREFAASREIEVPDSTTPEQRQVLELELLVDLRREVLMGFVLEGQLSQADFTKQMTSYEGLLNAARGTSPAISEAA